MKTRMIWTLTAATMMVLAACEQKDSGTPVLRNSSRTKSTSAVDGELNGKVAVGKGTQNGCLRIEDITKVLTSSQSPKMDKMLYTIHTQDLDMGMGVPEAQSFQKAVDLDNAVKARYFFADIEEQPYLVFASPTQLKTSPIGILISGVTSQDCTSVTFSDRTVYRIVAKSRNSITLLGVSGEIRKYLLMRQRLQITVRTPVPRFMDCGVAQDSLFTQKTSVLSWGVAGQNPAVAPGLRTLIGLYVDGGAPLLRPPPPPPNKTPAQDERNEATFTGTRMDLSMLAFLFRQIEAGRFTQELKCP